MALSPLLKCALNKNANQIQIYGGSNMVIKWINGTAQLLNISPMPLCDWLREVASTFKSISFIHVY